MRTFREMQARGEVKTGQAYEIHKVVLRVSGVGKGQYDFDDMNGNTVHLNLGTPNGDFVSGVLIYRSDLNQKQPRAKRTA